jgi:hypothetical protein
MTLVRGLQHIAATGYMNKDKIIETLKKRKELRTKELHKFSPHGSSLSRTKFVYAMSQLDLIDELLIKMGATVNAAETSKKR